MMDLTSWVGRNALILRGQFRISLEGPLSEIRQVHAAGLLNLTENDLPLGTMQGPPMADPPLKRSPDSVAKVRVAAQNLPENCDRSQPR